MGYLYDPTAVPTSVSKFQAKAALLQAGLYDQVVNAIATADNPLMTLAWAEAATFERNSPMILAVAASLELTSEQVDDLFRAAAVITV